MIRLTLIMVMASLSLVSCAETDRCATAAKPDECRHVRSAGGDVNDYLLYGMAGYMLANAVNGSGQRQPVLVPDPDYRGQRRAIASYRASPGFVRRSTTITTTTARPANVTSPGRTVTRSVTRSSAMPRYSAPSYRSSFRSSPSFRSR